MLVDSRTVLLPALAAFLVAGCYQPIITAQGVRQGALDTLLARAQQARGITADARVDVRVVSARDLEPVVVRAMHSDWNDEDLARYQESLVIVGLWPPGVDLAESLAATMGTEAVGLYVPEERALYVVRDPAIPWRVRFVSALARRDLAREYALAHELVHFLQHSGYPDLFAAVLGMKHSDDAAWAGQAAIEGDAVRYGFATLGSSVPLPTAVDFAAELASAATRGTFAQQPLLLRETVIFPYVSGYRLSTLEASLLLDRPPASTEQALHLERRREAFTLVKFRHTEVEGCEPVWSNSVGELGVSMLLRDFDAASAREAWEGWDGDRYLAFHCAGERDFVWLTTWDTEMDAREFADAYAHVAPAIAARSRLSGTPVVDVQGRDAVVYTSRLTSLASDVAVAAERHRVQSFEDVVEYEILRAGPKSRDDGRSRSRR